MYAHCKTLSDWNFAAGSMHSVMHSCRRWEEFGVLVRAISKSPSCISNHSMAPDKASTTHLNSVPNGSGFLLTNERLGKLPVLVVLFD